MVDLILIIPSGNVSHKLFSMHEAASIAGILTREKIGFAILDCDGTANDLRFIRSQAKHISVCIGIVLQWEHDIRHNTWLRKISTFIRKQLPDTHLCCLGRCATIFYAHLLENGLCDSVIRGEIEITLLTLLGRLFNGNRWWETKGLAYRSEGRTLKTPARPATGNLDGLPWPDHSYLKMRRRYPIAPLSTSRDCHGKCTFCFGKLFREANPNNARESRLRSPESVVDEIEHILGKYGVRQFYFVDDNFIPNGDEGVARAMKIARLIINRGLKLRFSMECRADAISMDVIKTLKLAGLQKVLIGFESGSEAVLKRYHKGLSVVDNLNAVNILKHAGVGVDPGFIMFDPWTSFEELQENLVFIEQSQINRCRSQYPLFRSLSILPGSEIETLYAKQGGIPEPRVSAVARALVYADHLIARHGLISGERTKVPNSSFLIDANRRDFLYDVFKTSISVIGQQRPSTVPIGGSTLQMEVEKIATHYFKKRRSEECLT